MMHYYLLTEAQEMLQRYYASIACSLLTDMLDVPLDTANFGLSTTNGTLQLLNLSKVLSRTEGGWQVRTQNNHADPLLSYDAHTRCGISIDIHPRWAVAYSNSPFPAHYVGNFGEEIGNTCL
ncbi:predicted protein [Plenodomus lingam JN3]|uniref:Uncharacterized protein n=1 Tax=Leptosphaeria maculans (strain JN3 / isolate v23.1.3 / race Av1-4-5-6-7-8) TaxID=985895 RepID=M1Z7M5_LEPMJ|nr:predicted protein [Plenodomus lingam JN3]